MWAEAAALRTSGELLQHAALVKCPVLAMHGDYDPSPADGVSEPLARVLTAPFEFIVLKDCGHTPGLSDTRAPSCMKSSNANSHEIAVVLQSTRQRTRCCGHARLSASCGLADSVTGERIRDKIAA